MFRRTFLTLSAATALSLPLARLAGAAPMAYTPGLVQQKLAAGETVFLDFKADWCTTCRAQERVLTELKAANPAYEKAISFVNVDWDSYKNAELTRARKIPRRSTLVVLKGNKELGRLVADTSPANIRKLMDRALSAATA